MSRVSWKKDLHSIDTRTDERISVTSAGTLVIKDVRQDDEGRYSCAPHSPIGTGGESSPVQVYVRGEYTIISPGTQ